MSHLLPNLSLHDYCTLCVSNSLLPYREVYTSLNQLNLQMQEIEDSFKKQNNSKLNFPISYNFQSQTFSQFKSSLNSPPTYSEWRRLKQRKIQIILINSDTLFINEKLSKILLNMLENLRFLCQSYFFGMEISILSNVLHINQCKAKSRLHKVTGRIQYLASDIINFIMNYRPRNVFSVIGVTIEDIYPDEMANFVLGHANFRGGAGVISLGKYADENWAGQIRLAPSRLFWRLTKVLTHELTHTFGLAHCYDFSCLMNESYSVYEAELQTLFLCPLCMKKLDYILKFNIISRMRELKIALTVAKNTSYEFEYHTNNRIVHEDTKRIVLDLDTPKTTNTGVDDTNTHFINRLTDEDITREYDTSSNCNNLMHYDVYHLGIGNICINLEYCQMELRKMDMIAKNNWDYCLEWITAINSRFILYS